MLLPAQVIPIAPMHMWLTGHGVAALEDNIYVVGGLGSSYNSLVSVEAYELASITNGIDRLAYNTSMTAACDENRVLLKSPSRGAWRAATNGLGAIGR